MHNIREFVQLFFCAKPSNYMWLIAKKISRSALINQCNNARAYVCSNVGFWMDGKYFVKRY